jgi:hypothetical protein
VNAAEHAAGFFLTPPGVALAPGEPAETPAGMARAYAQLTRRDFAAMMRGIDDSW